MHLSYSYKFLEDCRKDQHLKDIEEYIVGGKGGNAGIARTAPRKYRGGSVSKKSASVWAFLIPFPRRLPFTEKDDQILLNWINRPNIRLSGNKVYQELEARVCLIPILGSPAHKI